MQNTVDKLIKKTNLALLVGTNSWRDQFIEAITVSAGEYSFLGPVDSIEVKLIHLLVAFAGTALAIPLYCIKRPLVVPHGL